MKKVILETPYASPTTDGIQKNTKYAQEALYDCLKRGEAPLASHLLYTQVLDDTKPEERQLGIDAGLVWSLTSDYTVVYIDNGISKGMAYGIERATDNGKEVIYRRLYEEKN